MLPTMNVTLLNFKMPYLIFIFGAFILLHCKECASKKTVLFYFDKTDITGYDIEWLTTHVLQLSTECVKNGLDLQFTLKFPDKSNSAPNSLFFRSDYTVEGQSTLKNLLNHIKESPSYSVIYVITNVTKPSDEISVNEILDAIQIKRTEVNFLIGKPCSDDDSGPDALQKYGRIVSASNGYVHGPYILKSNLFTDLIYHGFTSVPLKIRFPTIVLKDNRRYCKNDSWYPTYNERTVSQPTFWTNEYEILSNRTRSSLIELKTAVTSQTHTTENCAEFDEIFHRYGIPPPEPDQESVSLGFYIAKDDFDFDYGFTIENVRYLNETYRRPINGTSNIIYLSPRNKTFEYGFDYFDVLFLNDTKFGNPIILGRIPETDMFVGSFYPPNEEYFFIRVAVQKKDGTFVRKSSTALSAAQGFGGDHRNPICKQEPIFEKQPEPEYQRSGDNSIVYEISTMLQGIIIFIGGVSVGFSLLYLSGFFARVLSLLCKFLIRALENGEATLDQAILDLEKAHYRDQEAPKA